MISDGMTSVVCFLGLGVFNFSLWTWSWLVFGLIFLLLFVFLARFWLFGFLFFLSFFLRVINEARVDQMLRESQMKRE